MTSEEILREIAALPAEARNEIEDFVAFLRERYKRAKSSSAVLSLESEEFIGMWADRDDMSNSTGWVRSVRDKHWAN